MMFWKDELARDIKAQPTITRAWLVSLTNIYPSIRVKTVDASGRVPVIQLNGQGEWLKPKEWADIHIANLKQRHLELHHRLATVGCDPSDASNDGGRPDSAETQTQSDPSELEGLRTNLARLEASYVKAIRELGRLYQGAEADPELKRRVAALLTKPRFQDG